jgi:hypothetical protein
MAAALAADRLKPARPEEAMPRLAAIALALALPAGLAAAAEFPAISIERTCRAAKPLDAEDRQPVENCMRDEREARSELEAQWAKFGETHRRLCVEQTGIGGYPSYVEVLTCLQMYETGPAAAGRRPKRQFGQ